LEVAGAEVILEVVVVVPVDIIIKQILQFRQEIIL
jgi:hypothetical protein